MCIQWYIKARVHLTCLLLYGRVRRALEVKQWRQRLASHRAPTISSKRPVTNNTITITAFPPPSPAAPPVPSEHFRDTSHNTSDNRAAYVIACHGTLAPYGTRRRVLTVSRVTSSPALEAEDLPTTRARRTRYAFTLYKEAATTSPTLLATPAVSGDPGEKSSRQVQTTVTSAMVATARVGRRGPAAAPPDVVTPSSSPIAPNG